MNRSGLQRLLPVILVVIVVAIAVAALVSLGRALFGGGSSPSPTPTTPPGKTALTNTTADRSVRMSVRGPIVADENFHSYTITAAPDKRNMTTYKGYTGTQLDSKDYGNSTVAYTQLVTALDRAHLMDGTPLQGAANSTDGVCAGGFLYEFDVMQGTNVIESLWTTTCKGSPGSLSANVGQVSNLFKVQIPDYQSLASKINMS